MRILLTADGDYTFAIDCTDLAANKSGETQFADGTVQKNSFTIDGTAPQINVTFDDGDKSPKDNYYKDTRTATITIIEQHFDADAATKGIIATGDDDGIKISPILGDWKDEGDTHSATIVFSEDAKYHLEVSYTDMAGNAGTSYSTDFYVDNVDPSLNITVNNREGFGAYKDEIVPVIDYYDVNFDSSEVSIEMTGINVSVSEPQFSGDDVIFTLKGKSGKKISWKAAIETNENHYGQTLTFDDFPDEDDYKEFDDIYTITVSLTDKAGRHSEKIHTFSVNRYGSTYDISAVKDMLGVYMQEENTVIVKEINPDELTEYSVTLFKNDETSKLNNKGDDNDYDMDSVGSDGEWHSYTYTIHQDNFEKDGIYSVTLHSKDKAGNISENTLDTKKSDINFAVDKTPPTATVLNLEDNKTYVEQSRTVLMTADDNLKLNEIKVYLDSDTQIYQMWNADDIEKMRADDSTEFKNEYSFDISGDSTNAHTLRVVCTDASGRITELVVKNFYITPNLITLLLIRYGWILGIVLAVGIAGISFGIVRKKKRNNGGA